MKPNRMRLLPIDQSGMVQGIPQPWPDFLSQNCKATAEFYKTAGFEVPWISYVSVVDGSPVGGGAFKGAPRNNRVEIAYYTVPELEGRGLASETARQLIDIARARQAGLLITAQTLATPNASTAILGKLGFTFAGTVIHPEDGAIWEWHLVAAKH